MEIFRDIAEFRSAAFEPVLSEDCQVNPRVYGAELAFWLCTRLAASGVMTGYPSWEDWGWHLEYGTALGSDFAVHCGNVDGSRDRWMLSLRRFRRGFLWRQTPTFSDAEPLIRALETILRKEPSISELKWMWNSSETGSA
jgi:hypothetical protein